MRGQAIDWRCCHCGFLGTPDLYLAAGRPQMRRRLHKRKGAWSPSYGETHVMCPSCQRRGWSRHPDVWVSLRCHFFPAGIRDTTTGTPISGSWQFHQAQREWYEDPSLTFKEALEKQFQRECFDVGPVVSWEAADA